MNVNKVVCSGNVAWVDDLRHTDDGLAILNFGLAINEYRRDRKTGESSEYTHFVKMSLFGNRAEGVSKWLSKGDKLAIEGKLRYSQWEKDGEKRSDLSVTVLEIDGYGNKKGKSREEADDAASDNHASEGDAKPSNTVNTHVPVFEEVDGSIYDADIPF